MFPGQMIGERFYQGSFTLPPGADDAVLGRFLAGLPAGDPAREAFPRERGVFLEGRERAWIEAEHRRWLDIVGPGGDVELRATLRGDFERNPWPTHRAMVLGVRWLLESLGAERAAAALGERSMLRCDVATPEVRLEFAVDDPFLLEDIMSRDDVIRLWVPGPRGPSGPTSVIPEGALHADLEIADELFDRWDTLVAAPPPSPFFELLDRLAALPPGATCVRVYIAGDYDPKIVAPADVPGGVLRAARLSRLRAIVVDLADGPDGERTLVPLPACEGAEPAPLGLPRLPRLAIALRTIHCRLSAERGERCDECRAEHAPGACEEVFARTPLAELAAPVPRPPLLSELCCLPWDLAARGARGPLAGPRRYLIAKVLHWFANEAPAARELHVRGRSSRTIAIAGAPETCGDCGATHAPGLCAAIFAGGPPREIASLSVAPAPGIRLEFDFETGRVSAPPEALRVWQVLERAPAWWEPP